MNAGFSKHKIIVPKKFQLSGFITRKEQFSDKILDSLYIRTVVLEADNRQFIIICYDVLALSWDFVTDVRKKLNSIYGIDKSSVILCATHTHSAPASVYLFRCGKIDESFITDLKASSLKAVEEAIQDMEIATFGYKTVKLTDKSYNRRIKLADGRVVMNQNPIDKVIKQGQIDEDFTILKFEAAGKTKGIILNFGAHACTVCEPGITADYPGELCRLVEEELGNDVVTTFWMGAAGNVNPIVEKFSYDEMKNNSTAIFSEIESALYDIKTNAFSSVTTIGRQILLDFVPPLTIAELEERKHLFSLIENGITNTPQVKPILKEISNILNIPPTETVEIEKASFVAGAMVEYYDTLLVSAKNDEMPKSIPFEINMIQIDTFKIFFLSAEIFSETARSIKGSYPASIIVSMSAGSGNVGYLPTAEAFADGGYEVDHSYKFYGLPGQLANNCEQRVIENIESIIKKVDMDG